CQLATARRDRIASAKPIARERPAWRLGKTLKRYAPWVRAVVLSETKAPNTLPSAPAEEGEDTRFGRPRRRCLLTPSRFRTSGVHRRRATWLLVRPPR